jgi:pyridoxamine 5'-phosphate oxidase
MHKVPNKSVYFCVLELISVKTLNFCFSVFQLMNSPKNLPDLRKEYMLKGLRLAEAAQDPIQQFDHWLTEALQAGLPEPSAMHLATVSAAGRPSARIVLLKGLSGDGFIFYTNYQSRKGKELAANPWACLTFFWPGLERQVRVEGKVLQTSGKQSDEYFHSRPRGSQLGAFISPQSQVIANRQVLEESLQQAETEFADGKVIPRPLHWGGYCVFPDAIEFWQGRPNRLHDRILYTKDAGGNWTKKRLAP